jgi:hypothetical protein
VGFLLGLIAPPAEQSKARSLEFIDCNAAAAATIEADRMMQRVRSDAVIARSAALDYRKDHWRIASGATGTMSWRVGIGAVPYFAGEGEGQSVSIAAPSNMLASNNPCS